ncbi:MAG: glutamate-1-semialdehyde 2,1-aminomutase [Microbacterium sp.]|uniref:Glutamate-1-semialdehyde 2,1-aminomutase n=1 Tax=Microbacterium ginsengisoli TaxID=400772 RepID=A0A3C1KGW3_9MICO|nr:glutamate-1-semialdehyde 2,1-aminomutase [uncultured Microbacterium sp.]MAL06430.1 glutamate-1-semialdehyde 2,1-aminomutase [Microbacterium sp.]MBN9207140.1 glutamate-1-semialdehyde 2,1-aminomutase [Microbacterium ginsengisoli]HAN25940.1 glutamate-1-semialdehyde 2,1-aminomutase [Microbacterium ginsengisoli]
MSDRNDDLFTRARGVIPGGVNSPVRAYGSVGGAPRFVSSAAGPRVTDAAGTSYVDLVASWGPALLGHAHPEVVEAVREAATRGLSFGAPTEAEVELAELIAARVRVGEAAPVERVRLVSTGTEATMTAIRLARGVTGRDLLVKFAGHYHGHSDGLLAAAGSGVATLALPGSAGVPAPIAAQTLVIDYNDLDAVREVFAVHGDRIAAVIVEAAAANMGVVAPLPGFNAALADIAHAHGALLILDEVLTGFRVHPAGFWGLQQAAGEHYLPDIITFGKVVGGGMPLAALGGRADVLDALAPVGPVYQAGTLSGNPLSVAAGLATLRLATPAVYEKVDAAASVVATALADALAAEGVVHAVPSAGSLFGVAFLPEAPRSYAQALTQEAWRYPAFFHAMLDAGVALPPSVYEAWFLTAAHDDDALAVITAALPGAARAAASAQAPA